MSSTGDRQPSVSVIIPAFDVESTIGTTLDSVARQTHPPAEIVVVDDGSTDGTAAVVAGYDSAVRYEWQPNGGPSAARNRGVALATGEVLAFLDADDLWPVDTLGVLLAYLASNPTLQIVQGQIQDIWPGSGVDDWMLGPPRPAFNLGSAIFRRSAIAQVGNFDVALRRGEDVDYWVRVVQQGVARQTVEDVTLFYRRKPLNHPDDKQVHYSNLLRTLKRALDRDRSR